MSQMFVSGFTSGSVVKNQPATQETGWIPGLGRFPEEENGNPLQYSSLGTPMDRGAWLATVHGIAKSQTRLSTHACICLGFLLDHSKLLEYWFYVFSPLVCGMELHSTQRKQ